VAAQRLPERGGRQFPPPRVRTNDMLQLGWPHFWLLSSILGAILGLIGFVFVVHLTSL
jgi:hypothetical protein